MDYKYEPFLDESNSYFIAYEKFKEDSKPMFVEIEDGEMHEIWGDEAFDEWEELERKNIELLFEAQYLELSKEEVYFYGCPIDVYAKTFSKRLLSFLSEFPDATENYFCEYELKNVGSYIMSNARKNRMSYSLKRRSEFLNEKISESQKKTKEPDTIDLSDTSTIEKIIYLHKLGVVSLLRSKRPFNTSVNSLATVLSAITGAGTSTIQSYLNPMLSINVDQNKNPLNSEKPVNKVQKQLNDIGFNLEDTN
jgi:hypothetical protein